jgi:hypothetical protein
MWPALSELLLSSKSAFLSLNSPIFPLHGVSMRLALFFGVACTFLHLHAGNPTFNAYTCADNHGGLPGNDILCRTDWDEMAIKAYCDEHSTCQGYSFDTTKNTGLCAKTTSDTGPTEIGLQYCYRQVSDQLIGLLSILPNVYTTATATDLSLQFVSPAGIPASSSIMIELPSGHNYFTDGTPTVTLDLPTGGGATITFETVTKEAVTKFMYKIVPDIQITAGALIRMTISGMLTPDGAVKAAYGTITFVDNEWHLAPAGLTKCDYGTGASLELCFAAVSSCFAAISSLPSPVASSSNLNLGSSGTCNDSGWGERPLGCSVKEVFNNQGQVTDWTAFYKTSGSTSPSCISPAYKLVCSRTSSTPLLFPDIFSSTVLGAPSIVYNTNAVTSSDVSATVTFESPAKTNGKGQINLKFPGGYGFSSAAPTVTVTNSVDADLSVQNVAFYSGEGLQTIDAPECEVGSRNSLVIVLSDSFPPGSTFTLILSGLHLPNSPRNDEFAFISLHNMNGGLLAGPSQILLPQVTGNAPTDTQGPSPLLDGYGGECPNMCQNHGICGKNSQCICHEGFHGPDCKLRYCPFGRAWADIPIGPNDAHNLAECSRKGVCNAQKGECACEAPFTGPACDRMQCPRTANDLCSGHGDCVALKHYSTSRDGIFYDWTAKEVQVVSTLADPLDATITQGNFVLHHIRWGDLTFDYNADAEVVQNAINAIVSGAVSVTRSGPTAFGGYSWSITFEGAVGHGDQEMLTLINESITATWSGSTDQVVITEYTKGAEMPHKYDDPWDADMIQGCVCEAGWSGYDCSQQTCPFGDDPLTSHNDVASNNPIEQVNEKQILECTCAGTVMNECTGSIAISFRGKRSLPIPHNANKVEIIAALMVIPGANHVEVIIAGGTMLCDSDGAATIIEFVGIPGNLPPLVISHNLASPSNVAPIVKLLHGGEFSSIAGAKSVQGNKEYAECSNRGACDRSTGLCTCLPGFSGSQVYLVLDCGFYTNTWANRECPFVNIASQNIVCGGHGTCLSDYTCQCDEGYSGYACTDVSCPKHVPWFGPISNDNIAHDHKIECSGRGTCNRDVGKCTCQSGFSGDACQHIQCANDCSGRGNCYSMKAIAALSSNEGASYGEDPTNTTVWDAEMLYSCICDDPTQYDYNEVMRGTRRVHVVSHPDGVGFSSVGYGKEYVGTHYLVYG